MTLAELQSKLDALRTNVDRLGRVPAGSYEEFVSDFRNVARNATRGLGRAFPNVVIAVADVM